MRAFLASTFFGLTLGLTSTATHAHGGDTYSSVVVGGDSPDGEPPLTNLAMGPFTNATTSKNRAQVNGGPTRLARPTNGTLTQLEVEVEQTFSGDETDIAITWRHRNGGTIWSQIQSFVSILPDGTESNVIGFDIGDRLSFLAPADGIDCGAEWEFDSGTAVATFQNGDVGEVDFEYGNGGIESPEPTSLFKTSFFPRFIVQNGLPFDFSPPSAITFNFKLRILEDDCLGDLNNDGQVNSADLGLLIAVWGTDGADLNNDGQTNSADLGLLIAFWGPCP